jgi:hypothetical protein
MLGGKETLNPWNLARGVFPTEYQGAAHIQEYKKLAQEKCVGDDSPSQAWHGMMPKKAATEIQQ